MIKNNTWTDKLIHCVSARWKLLMLDDETSTLLIFTINYFVCPLVKCNKLNVFCYSVSGFAYSN